MSGNACVSLFVLNIKGRQDLNFRGLIAASLGVDEGWWATLSRADDHDPQEIGRAIHERSHLPVVVVRSEGQAGWLQILSDEGAFARLEYPSGGARSWSGDLRAFSMALGKEPRQAPQHARVTGAFLDDAKALLREFGVGLTLPSEVFLPSGGFTLARAHVGRGTTRVGRHYHDFTRSHYVLGKGEEAGKEFLGIWDRDVGGLPVARFAKYREQSAHRYWHQIEDRFAEDVTP